MAVRMTRASDRCNWTPFTIEILCAAVTVVSQSLQISLSNAAKTGQHYMRLAK